MELKGRVINFLGDSITEGCGTSDKSKVFMNVLAEKYGLKEARNYGIGGTRIARQVEITNPVVDRDFVMRAEEMQDADMVVVFGGTNDYGHGQAPLGKIEDNDVYTFYGALHILIKSLKEKYSDKPIVFITPLHRHNEYGEGTWKPEGVEQRPLFEYVNAVKEVCALYSVPVLDLFTRGEIKGNDWEWCREYMPDGLHPNDKGHAIIASELGSFLESL